MELETLFGFETVGSPKFVLQIRRDPELGHRQVYLVNDKTKQDDGKVCISFIQALGDATRDRISAYYFLTINMNAPTPSPPMMRGCAIDERERLLYILFGGGNHEVFLRLVHLHYQAADKFGYRRIVTEQGGWVHLKRQLLCHELPPVTVTAPTVHSLAVCAVTGKLVTGFGTVDYSNQRMALFPADLVFSPEQDGAQVDAVADRLPFMTPLQTAQMQLRSCVFSRSNHLLFWLGFHHQFNRGGIQPTADDGGCIILKSFVPGLGHPWNSHLNQLKIDPVKLVKSLLRESVFDNFVAQVPNTMPKYVFFGLHLTLLGHVHKYVVFNFHQNYILAAKWPKEWYKLQELPSTRMRKLVCVDPEKKLGVMNGACLYGTDLYLKSHPGDEVQLVHKVSLGQQFKDYRLCAFCGKQENKKKRNKEGKRVSTFKVCRMCKELNFHVFHSDRDLACHYCSFECVRKHWKEHKIVHKKDPIDRK